MTRAAIQTGYDHSPISNIRDKSVQEESLSLLRGVATLANMAAYCSTSRSMRLRCARSQILSLASPRSSPLPSLLSADSELPSSLSSSFRCGRSKASWRPADVTHRFS